MAPKWFIYFCLLIGSFVGMYVPTLWGGNILSFSSIIFSAIGGIVGVFAAIRIGKSL